MLTVSAGMGTGFSLFAECRGANDSRPPGCLRRLLDNPLIECDRHALKPRRLALLFHGEGSRLPWRDGSESQRRCAQSSFAFLTYGTRYCLRHNICLPGIDVIGAGKDVHGLRLQIQDVRVEWLGDLARCESSDTQSWLTCFAQMSIVARPNFATSWR